MLEVPADGGGKLKVAYIVLQAAPDVIDVQRVPACGPHPRTARRPRKRGSVKEGAIRSA